MFMYLFRLTTQGDCALREGTKQRVLKEGRAHHKGVAPTRPRHERRLLFSSPVRRSHFLRLPAGRAKSLAALVPAMRASYFLASLASPPHSASALPNSFLAVVSSLLRCVHLTCAR